MRKRIVLVLIGVLAFSASLPAIGAVKSGSSCSKLGSTSTSVSKKFTCIKSGKKLVWNKGVVIKPIPKPSITPSPNPSDSPIPSQTPSPSPNPSVDATNNSNPEVIPSPSPKATGPIGAVTFDNLEVDWVNQIARSEVLRVYESAKPLVGAYEVIAGPYVDASQIVEEKRLLDIAARMFSSYFKPEKYQVVFFSEKDGPWADQALATYGGGFRFSSVFRNGIRCRWS